MRNKNNKGFTLIEMIIVIAIIGVISMILIPSIYNYVRKAREKAAIADAKVVKDAVETSLIEHLMLGHVTSYQAFNKILYLDQTNPVSKRETESVGCFTSYSWSMYRRGELNDAANASNQANSQLIDYIIAKGIDDAFTETWDTGKKVNPMRYNTSSNNCAKYCKDNNTNFAIVVVYNRTGSVRLMQLYRKDVLVTYVNGEYIVNMNNDAHFVGSGTWDTIYRDAGSSSPEEYCKINLANGQFRNDGTWGGWY